MPIIDPSAPYGIRLEASDNVGARLDSICKPASDEQLASVLKLMGVDPSGMTSKDMGKVMQEEFDSYMVDILEFEPVDWYFDDTIYEFQANEIKKVVLAGSEYLPVSASYYFWESEFNTIKDEAKAIATALGYSYTVSGGSLFSTSLGMVTGIVAGGNVGMGNIVFSTVYPTTATESKARAGAFMLEAISGPVGPSSGNYYTLDMDGFYNRPASTAQTLASFNWSANSVYDYVLFLDSSSNYVNFSDLSFDDLAFYMQTPEIAELRLADAFARQKDGASSGFHMRVWAYRRQFEFSQRLLAETKEYVVFLRGLPT